MVLARLFRICFLPLLFASLCLSQYGYQQPGYSQHQNPYQQGQFNQQQQQQHYGQQQYGQSPQQQQQSFNPKNMGQGSQQMSPASTQQRQSMVLSQPESGIVYSAVRPTIVNASTKNTVVNIQLFAYANPSLLLPNDITCKCPTTEKCAMLDQNQNLCKFALSVILTGKGQSFSYISTEFFQMPDDGTLTFGNGGANASYILQMDSRPQTMDVIVRYFGMGMFMNTSMAYFKRMVPVDAFIYNISAIAATKGGQSPPRMRTKVQALENPKDILDFSYSVQCIGTGQGPDCDLSCREPGNSTTVVICTDPQKVVYACTYATYINDCQKCLNGANDQFTGCRTTLIAAPSCDRGVSAAFRTWTIVLGCLLGIAVVFIIALIIFYVIVRNKSEQTPRNQYQQQRYDPPSQPLLHASKDDEWNRPRPNPAALGVVSHISDPEVTRSSDQSESVRHVNGMPSPRREVAV
ncbi:hypothetical protein L596_003492 [Steinernema carpocapsae]|uniref:Uncharacterized protein n=1 Tax=Steinernema carpocapsae TaxID=34508 RepID=A0A4U8UUC8_STECR|nr:hypothetical protein L596_003492 [Steinernema carpocapsae]